MSSGRAVMINDHELGATQAVWLEKDKLQIADMDYVGQHYFNSCERAVEVEAKVFILDCLARFDSYALLRAKRT
jgi:hypothetical protein